MKLKIDAVVHEPVRLNTMMLLAQSPRTFSEVMRSLDVSNGALDNHTLKLEDVGYIRRTRQGICPRNGQPYTMLQLTADGYQALQSYCRTAEFMIRSLHTALSRTACL